MSFGSLVIGEEAAQAQEAARVTGVNVFGPRVVDAAPAIVVTPEPPPDVGVVVAPPPFDADEVIPDPLDTAPPAAPAPLPDGLMKFTVPDLKEFIAANPTRVDDIFALERQRNGGARGTIVRALLAAELGEGGAQRADVQAALEKLL